MKSKVALAVAIVLAILAAIGTRAYLRQREQAFQQKIRNVTVLCAKTNIKKGTVVKPEMVDEKEVPEQVVQDGGTLLKDQLGRILGQRISKDVRAGENLLWAHFAAESPFEEAMGDLSPGYRQITIPVDKVTGCAGRLLPDSIVDVLVTLRTKPDPNGAVQSVTQVALTGMKVVAVDLNVRTPATFFSARDRRDFASYSTVTLRALPLQASLLAFLTEQGKLHLIIRGPGDPSGQDPSKSDKVTLDGLDRIIQKAAEEKPAALPSSK